MFNIGFSEMLVIAGLALILIGPKQLPEVARNIGRLLNDLKRSANSFTDELKSQVDFDLEERLRQRRQNIQAPPPPYEAPVDVSSTPQVMHDHLHGTESIPVTTDPTQTTFDDLVHQKSVEEAANDGKAKKDSDS